MSPCGHQAEFTRLLILGYAVCAVGVAQLELTPFSVLFLKRQPQGSTIWIRSAVRGGSNPEPFGVSGSSVLLTIVLRRCRKAPPMLAGSCYCQSWGGAMVKFATSEWCVCGSLEMWPFRVGQEGAPGWGRRGAGSKTGGDSRHWFLISV